MKKLLAALLALSLAPAFCEVAQARALFVRTSPVSATNAVGIDRIAESVVSAAINMGGAFDVVSINDFSSGVVVASPPYLVSQRIRDGEFWPNGVGSGTAIEYGLIVILGDDKDTYTGTTGANCTFPAGVGGMGIIRSVATNFTWVRPGMLVSGTGITGRVSVVGVDSLFARLTVSTSRTGGTIVGATNANLTWQTPLRPDSLTLVGNATNGNVYPRVPVLRFGQYMGTAGAFAIASGRCSTGAGALQTYTAHQDSTVNVYEVGNPYRSWKSPQGTLVNSVRDARGWRPVLARVSTRLNSAGHANGNYDFPDPACAVCEFSSDPDTVVLWVVQNRDAAGVAIGGDAAPNIYATGSPLNATNAHDPGTIMTALALADSLSGGALLGDSGVLPLQMSFGIDDGWRRGDSKFASTYGGIGVDDTTALIASIDSLATLRIPFVLGVELDSLDSVLLSDGVTAHGDLYDKRWWARAEPWIKYSPHCHAGIQGGVNRSQNISTKYLRPLDIFGLTRNRLIFTSPDSMLAYGATDYVNESTADTGSVYWLNKRAWFLCDSTFGRSRVDRQIIPAGGCWSPPSVTRTNALVVDSLITAFVASGAASLRMLINVNMVGDPLSNTFGYYNTFRTMTTGRSGYPGMPGWMPSRIFGRQFDLVPIGYFRTDGAGGSSGYSSSVASWSHSRYDTGGWTNLWQRIIGKPFHSSSAQSAGIAYNVTMHVSDFGSSGRSGEETRPSFYTLKYVTNAVRVANSHARRDLVRIVYPEEVRP